ncbi:MAG TPA: SAM-dependent methyltransferase [Micromonosporaceae bacterium]
MAVPWRQAMAQALYGPGGFFTRADQPGGAGGHFRTSVHASPLFATALLRLIVTADEALDQPDPFDVVDIGAGAGHLLRRLSVLAPTYLRRRLRLSAVELAPRPHDLPEHIGWYQQAPPPRGITGVLLATEWLDNVPLEIAEIGPDGELHYVLVDQPTGVETLGPILTDADAAWAARWWSEPEWAPGVRIELGPPRDEAWAASVAALVAGLAITVDYGHMWYDRPLAGTLAGFLAGRDTTTIPDGSRDLTAHVAIDAVCAAGEAVAGQPAALMTQRDALAALGLDGARPPLSLAEQDPAGYVQALSLASQAAELMDLEGLGRHFWIVQPVGIPADVLPMGLRP